jgi:hypothetical protein
MTYDPTLDDALAHARAILARGDSTAAGGGYPVIWDDDRFDAHLLLARFVAEIERLRERVKWFEASGGVAAHTRVFHEMARAENAEAEIERLRAGNAPPQQPDEQVLITRYRALPERGRAALRQLLDAWQ